ncbi:zeta toxin family protein [Chitinophaga sp. RCC_12]|uniref:zeta toxin family protein n=1 Tax=Chitinophaga sp. RCC_12 TaxID=3239226 RepID=UPI0035244092
MSQKYSRVLIEEKQVEFFLRHVLDFDPSGLDGIIPGIVEGEIGILNVPYEMQTYSGTKYRDKRFFDEPSREALRALIVDELLSETRLINDEDICLGKGGALPVGGIVRNKKAYILIGLPASGKSSIACLVADNFGAIILDADFAKRKLPEYSKYPFGASLVHEESSKIISNPNPEVPSLTLKSIDLGYNILLPKIGQDVNAIIDLAEFLHFKQYEVHLTLVSLLRHKATVRAIHRFYETKRYVPIGLIFDGYGNDPCLTYYLIKNKLYSFISSYGAISTDVPKGQLPYCIDLLNDNPAKLFEFRGNILI